MTKIIFLQTSSSMMKKTLQYCCKHWYFTGFVGTLLCKTISRSYNACYDFDKLKRYFNTVPESIEDQESMKKDKEIIKDFTGTYHPSKSLFVRKRTIDGLIPDLISSVFFPIYITSVVISTGVLYVNKFTGSKNDETL